MCLCIYVGEFVFVYICGRVCVFVYVGVCVCVCVNVCNHSWGKMKKVNDGKSFVIMCCSSTTFWHCKTNFSPGYRLSNQGIVHSTSHQKFTLSFYIHSYHHLHIHKQKFIIKVSILLGDNKRSHLPLFKNIVYTLFVSNAKFSSLLTM